MDLGAYARIKDLNHLMAENGIYVPRLRGLRLMAEEEPMTDAEIEHEANVMGAHACQRLIYSEFRINSHWHRFSKNTEKLCKRYIVYDKNGLPKAVRWNVLRGKKRKLFKYCLKETKKKVYRNYKTFSKYAGRDDVLYIHARIGGLNWDNFDGAEIEKQPWFLEKVDDVYDCTYCDIYARIEVKDE